MNPFDIHDDWSYIDKIAREQREMKTLAERIAAYAERKGITVMAAHEKLLAFALDTLDARRKGAEAVNARPDHAKHLARARQSRGGKR